MESRTTVAIAKLHIRTTLCFLVILLCSVSTAVEASGDQNNCTETDLENNEVSCHFEDDLCGWKNSQGNNHNWYKTYGFLGIGNEYVSLHMRSKPANTSGRLESPWLCSTGGKSFSLSFRYFLYYNNKCRLSVFLQNSTNTMKVWSEQRADQVVSLRELSSPLYLTTPVNSFKIIFEGRKLTDRPCGNTYNEIALDDIVFREADGSVSSVTTYASTSSMTQSSSHTSDVSESTKWTNIASPSATQEAATDIASSYTTDDTSIGIGVIAGIVCGIVVAAVMAVIIIILMVKRRRKNNRPPTGASLTPTPQRMSADPGSAPVSSDDYETPHDYQNTMHDLTATRSTSLPAGSVSELESTTAAHAAPENYERLERRHDDAEYYTSLKTSSAVESAAGGDNYEMLSRGTSTHDYTALSHKK